MSWRPEPLRAICGFLLLGIACLSGWAGLEQVARQRRHQPLQLHKRSLSSLKPPQQVLIEAQIVAPTPELTRKLVLACEQRRVQQGRIEIWRNESDMPNQLTLETADGLRLSAEFSGGCKQPGPQIRLDAHDPDHRWLGYELGSRVGLIAWIEAGPGKQDLRVLGLEIGPGGRAQGAENWGALAGTGSIGLLGLSLMLWPRQQNVV